MMTHDEMIAVIQHHRDGGEVEFFKDKSWNKIVGDPSWNFRYCMYRPYIEPKPKKVIVLETWLCAFKNDYYTSEATAGYFEGIETVKLLSTREVEID